MTAAGAGLHAKLRLVRCDAVKEVVHGPLLLAFDGWSNVKRRKDNKTPQHRIHIYIYIFFYFNFAFQRFEIVSLPGVSISATRSPGERALSEERIHACIIWQFVFVIAQIWKMCCCERAIYNYFSSRVPGGALWWRRQRKMIIRYTEMCDTFNTLPPSPLLGLGSLH